MYLASNVAKMAKDGISRAAIEETQFLFNQTHSVVGEEKSAVLGLVGITR